MSDQRSCVEKKRYSVFALLALIVGSALYLNSFAAVADLSATRYLQHVVFLAADALKGRGNGTPELTQAADYIAAQFKAAGLQPQGDNGTYFQTFEITTGTEFGPKNEAQMNGRVLKLNDEFVPIAFSNTASVTGQVAFVGYGITAPELHYDDYQGVDAKGKIVVVLRHEPQELDERSVFNGKNFTSHATFDNKAANARQHGAIGIIFITDPNNHAPDQDEVGSATKAAPPENIGIPSIHARRTPLLEVFRNNGKDVPAIQKQIDTDLKPASFELPMVTFRITTDIVRIRKPVRNVIGALPGSDPTLKNEWVVIGAHYDHLGLGDQHSLAPAMLGQIHHGADDNASGTAGVIELAGVASKDRAAFKRSLLFMTFSGEELGLLGSNYFVNHSTIPLQNVMGMINLDMIGRVTNDRLFVEGVGTSPKFRPWVDEFNKTIGLKLQYSNSGFGGSDHMSFTIKKIPVVFFFSGLHTDYHKPSDTADKINAQGALKVLSLVHMTMERMAGDRERLEFTEVQQPRQQNGGGGDGYGAYFGSIPDFRDDLQGVLFADVTPSSPAAKGGLKAGDLLVQFDGKSIENLYDFTYALRAKKPGDVVVVVVKRNGQDVKATITLEARR
jgi:hypothetical protein